MEIYGIKERFIDDQPLEKVEPKYPLLKKVEQNIYF